MRSLGIAAFVLMIPLIFAETSDLIKIETYIERSEPFVLDKESTANVVEEVYGREYVVLAEQISQLQEQLDVVDQCNQTLQEQAITSHKTLLDTIANLNHEVDNLEIQLVSAYSELEKERAYTAKKAEEFEAQIIKLDQATGAQIDSMTTTVSTIENRIDQMASSQQYLLECTAHPDCIIFGKAKPCQWQGGIEYLCWSVQASELDYVVEGFPRTLPAGEARGAVGDLRSARYGWGSGVRLCADYTSRLDYWDFMGQYTYFYDSGTNSTSRPLDTNIVGTFSQAVTGDTLELATSHIRFRYNLLEGLLSRRFIISPRLLARFNMGALFGWIDQRWRIDYSPETGPQNTRIDQNWLYRGGGLKAGAGVDWNLKCGWGMLGEVSAAALVGWYENEHIARVSTPAYSPIDSHNDQWRFAQSLQLAIGPSYTTCLRDCMTLRLFVLYEMTTWLGLQEIDRSVIGPVNDVTGARESRHVEGILGLQGFTFGLDAAF